MCVYLKCKIKDDCITKDSWIIAADSMNAVHAAYNRKICILSYFVWTAANSDDGDDFPVIEDGNVDSVSSAMKDIFFLNFNCDIIFDFNV